MIVLLFAILFIICVVSMFTFSYRINSITSSLYGIQYPLIECSIPLTIQDEEVELYFDQDKLKNSFNNYLEREVAKYVDSYDVEYYFYNVENGGYCDIKNCQGVEIYFSASIMFGYEYKRTLKYEIKEGKIHE